MLPPLMLSKWEPAYPPPNPGAASEKFGSNSPLCSFLRAQHRESNTWRSHGARKNSLIIGSLKRLKIMGVMAIQKSSSAR